MMSNNHTGQRAQKQWTKPSFETQEQYGRRERSARTTQKGPGTWRAQTK